MKKLFIVFCLILSMWMVLFQSGMPVVYAAEEINPATYSGLPEEEVTALRNSPHHVIDKCVAANNTAASDAGAIAKGPIYIMGDSITFLAKETYQKKFADPWKPTIEGLSSRQIKGGVSPDGMKQIQNDKDIIKDTGAIVIALGTNGTSNLEVTTKKQVEDFMKDLKELNKADAPVFWVNVINQKDLSGSRTTNKAIKEAVGSEATIIDWYGEAKDEADLASFNEGVHPTSQKDFDLLVDLVYKSVTNSTGSSAASITIDGPFKDKANPGDTVKAGDTYKGKASTYGEDPATNYVDPGDVDSSGNPLKPALPGATNAQPGIAMYNHGTLGGWWKVVDPDGKGAILQQTDYGPSTSRMTDINSAAARAVFGYKQGNKFPTDQGDWKAEYMGKTKPDGAITSATGRATDPGNASKGEKSDACCDSASTCCTADAAGGGSVGSLRGGSPREQVFNYFLDAGLSNKQAAAITGNFEQESGFRPMAIQNGGESKDPHDAGDLGWGIAQWSGPAAKVIDNAKALGIKDPIYELKTQLDIVLGQMKSTSPTGVKNTYEGIKKIDDVILATQYFTKNFEGPSDIGPRGPFALKAFNNYKDNKPAGGRGASAATGASQDCDSGGGKSAGVNGWDLEGENAMTFFDQCDSKWANKPYGAGKNSICASGCGIASLAMILKTLKGANVTPQTLANKYGDKYHGAEGTAWGLWSVAAKDYDLKMTDIGSDLSKAAASVKAGGLVMISVDGGAFTSRGHLMVIRAVNDKGEFLLADPNNSANKNDPTGDTNKTAYSADFLRGQGALKHLWSWSK